VLNRGCPNSVEFTDAQITDKRQKYQKLIDGRKKQMD